MNMNKLKNYSQVLLNWLPTCTGVICGFFLIMHESGYIKLSFTLFTCVAVITIVYPLWEKRREYLRNRANNAYKNIVSDLPSTLKVFSLFNIETIDVESIREAQGHILTEICELVSGYFGGKQSEFNANIMRFIPMSETEANWDKNVHFVENIRTPNEYKGILRTTRWARSTSEFIKEFSLPVAITVDKLLCGAPWACEQSVFEIVTDTKNHRYMRKRLNNQSYGINEKIIEYFKKQDFRSFFCYRIEYECRDEMERLGVLTVQSTNKNILSEGSTADHELIVCLKPYCKILALLLKKEDEIIKRDIDREEMKAVRLTNNEH